MCMQLQLKKLFMGFHLKIKIIHRHVVGGEKKVLQTENLWACITGQIVFVLESFGSKATRSECLLLIMVLQLDLYENFVYTFNPASYAGGKCPSPSPASIAWNSNALFLIKFSSCWCCSPLSKDQLTLPTAHEGNKSTWLTETLTFTPRPQHLQKPLKNKNTHMKVNHHSYRRNFCSCENKAEAKGWNPVQAWIFFQAFFSQLQKYNSVYNCDDLLSYNSAPRSSNIWFSYIHVQ